MALTISEMGLLGVTTSTARFREMPLKRLKWGHVVRVKPGGRGSQAIKAMMCCRVHYIGGWPRAYIIPK